MTTPNHHKFFLNKKFFIYLRRPYQSNNPNNIEKSAELIKLFGGQIEQFLDSEVSYVLTDIPKDDWPPRGNDNILVRAINFKVKLMSQDDLINWCSRYINSQSSSEDDDEQGSKIKRLQPPYIKLEDYNSRYSPSIKEFVRWPEINIGNNLVVGKSFFNDSNIILGTPNNSAQLTQQANSIFNIATRSAQTPVNQVALRGPKRRHSVYCEICNHRLTERVDEHINTQAHRDNTERLSWDEVSSVIECLPSLSTLNRHRLTNLSIPDGVEYQEFLCLHKVDSVSQLFIGSPYSLELHP